jgi:glutamate dehydrogenase/leucine dehydrogenase
MAWIMALIACTRQTVTAVVTGKPQAWGSKGRAKPQAAIVMIMCQQAAKAILI